jgi:splicing factor 3A subunit 1
MFTARQGRRFLEGLSVREGRNFQFDFLRPSHSLYGYFNRMVEQYTKVMHPSSQQIARLENGQTNKWAIMEESQARGEWEKVRRDKEQKKKEDAEKEAHAFAQIDWQDFAVVQTIEFTSADQSIELPAPTNIDALRTMGLNERRMAAMIVEESGDHNMPLGAGSASIKDAGLVLTEGGPDEVEMDEDSEDEETQAQKKRETEELARAREVQAKAMGQAGMKIRKDYQPKGA